MRAWRNRHLVALLSFVIAGIGVAAAPAAAAAPAGARPAAPGGAAAARAAARPDDERRVCPAPSQPGQLACQAVYQLAGSPAGARAFVPDLTSVPGYGPPACAAPTG